MLILEVYFLFLALTLPSWKWYAKISNILYVYKYFKMQKKIVEEMQNWRIWITHILGEEFFQNFHFLYCHLLQVSCLWVHSGCLQFPRKSLFHQDFPGFSWTLYSISHKVSTFVAIFSLYFPVYIFIFSHFPLFLPEICLVLLLLNRRTRSQI